MRLSGFYHVTMAYRKYGRNWNRFLIQSSWTKYGICCTILLNLLTAITLVLWSMDKMRLRLVRIETPWAPWHSRKFSRPADWVSQEYLRRLLTCENELEWFPGCSMSTDNSSSSSELARGFYYILMVLKLSNNDQEINCIPGAVTIWQSIKQTCELKLSAIRNPLPPFSDLSLD